METNKYVPEASADNASQGCPLDPSTLTSTDTPAASRKAQLRVPTNTTALSWWDPKYWSKARPTEFCYGDCGWGLEEQETPLSIAEWVWMLWRREELEYSLPGDPEPFVASPINRFRNSWYVMHLVVSFWTRAETTKSIHAFLKKLAGQGHIRPSFLSLCVRCRVRSHVPDLKRRLGIDFPEGRFFTNTGAYNNSCRRVFWGGDFFGEL